MPRTKEAFASMRQATRLKIEAAALSLFARRGLSVRVGEIARAAGVSQGLLYSHYPSKDALIAELVRQATTVSGRTVMEIAEGGGDAAGKIKSISSMMCQMFTDTPIGIDYFMFMTQAGVSGFCAPEAAAYSEEFPNPAETLARVVARGQAEGSAADGDPARLSVVYWAVIQGLCCYAVSGMTVSPEPEMLNRILLKEDHL